MADVARMMDALRQADAAGNTEDAQKLSDMIRAAKAGAPYEIGKAAVQGASGFNEGLAEFLGMPVDIVNAGLSYVDVGTDEPVGGSESLKKLLTSMGTVAPAEEQYSGIRRVGKEVGATVPMITGVGAIARPLQLAGRTSTEVLPNIGRALIEPAIQKPLRTATGEVIAATGAGTGAAVAEKYAPDSPMAEIAGQLVGGVTPSLLRTLPMKAAGMATGVPLAGPLIKKGVERLSPQARAASAQAQIKGMLGEEMTEQVARNITEGQTVAGKVPGLAPSTAELSGSQALARTQAVREGQLSGTDLEQAVARHEGNVKAINDFAESVAPSGDMDVDIIVGRAGRKVEDLLGDIEAARPGQEIPRAKPVLADVGASMRDDLILRRRDASAAMSDMADEMGLNEVDITPQYTEIRESLIETMTPSGRFAKPEQTPDVVKILIDDRNVNLETSLADLKELRESMGADLRGAISGAAPDAQKARYLKMGIATLDEALGTLDIPGKSAEYKQFRQAYYDSVIVPFERGAAFKVKQKGTRGHYVTADEKVAHQFFGPKKETDMAQFVQVFGDDPKQMDAMRSVIMDDFNAAVVRDGEIKPRLMERWLERFGGTLNNLPGVRDELADVAGANAALNRRNTTLNARQRQIEDAVLTRKLKQFKTGTKTGESVVADAIKNPRVMKQLVNRLRSDPEALTALRRHVWDDIIASDAKTMRANMDANQKSLKIALGDKHLSDIDTIIKAQEMVERVPAPAGAAITARPMQAIEEQIGMGIPAVASRIYAIQSGRIGSKYMVTEMFSRFMRGQSEREMNRLLDTALYDPEIARDLANAIKFPASVPVTNRMKKHLFNLGMSGEEE